MVDKSDSSFSSYIEEYSEDSENDSFLYDTFVENEVLVDVDFGDNHTEIMGEITEISVNEAVASGGEAAAGGGVAVGGEAAAGGEVVAGGGVAAGGEAAAGGEVVVSGEVQILANSKMQADEWNYFTRKEKVIRDQNGDEKFEKFIFCNVGQCHLSSNNSTSTLECHLKSRHHDAYIELNEKKININPWSTEIQKAKHELFVNWIVIDQQPFTIVDNSSFQKFMSSIQPRYKLPSRHTLKEMVMTKFKTACKEVHNYLQLSTSKVSFTMDMWTSISSLGILAITIHYINDSWQFEHFVLDVLYIPSPHDSSTIKNAVLKITDELKVTSQLVGITTDNEAKMIAATRKIKENLESLDF